MKPGAL